VTRLRENWRRFAEGVAALAFATLFLAFIIQIVSRYLLNAPVAWTLELCAIAYVWVVFWSAGVLVPERRHITFDILYHLVPLRQRRWLAMFLTGSVGLVFLAALPGVLDYILFLGRRSSMLLKIRMDLIYACFALVMVAVILGAMARLWRLSRPGWPDELQDPLAPDLLP
jgi:TRAP-type C4-dicarboxylate transport system permease small subunit